MARLTSARRKALPTGDFALPGRRYPLNDKNHARNALSRASANASPSEVATIRRKVKAKFPSIGVAKLPKTSLRSMRAPRIKKPSY